MPLKFINTTIPDLTVIESEPIQDGRGFFERILCMEEVRSIGHVKNIAQVNQSLTKTRGSIRGMHYQKPPFAEIKFVRCLSGSVFDVAVDLRMGSPTFLHWYGEVLSSENFRTMYIPEGFAHGFQTLEENCTMLYIHTIAYSANHSSIVRFDDPRVGISWPLPIETISERDLSAPYLDAHYEGLQI